jgi:hypothetical protein
MANVVLVVANIGDDGIADDGLIVADFIDDGIAGDVLIVTNIIEDTEVGVCRMHTSRVGERNYLKGADDIDWLRGWW